MKIHLTHYTMKMFYCFFVPGKVEAFGKHIDYAGAITYYLRWIGFCVSKINGIKKVRIKEIDPTYGERVFQYIQKLKTLIRDWRSYPMTVVKRVCMNFRTNLNGVDIMFGCDLPISLAIFGD